MIKTLVFHPGRQPTHNDDFMNTKQIQLVLVIFGLSSCLIRAADDEAKLMQENPDWHITSEVFTNPPYWLVPTNVPFRLGPLSNGKWVWTTNASTGWYEQGRLSVTMDGEREQQISRQWLQQQFEKWDTANPPGVAYVREYYHQRWWDTNGRPAMWQGMWVEDTNTGWRVNLRFYQANKYQDATMTFHVGSVVTNSGPGLLPSPDGKFAKLELLDANGKAVSTRRGAALNLYLTRNAVLEERQITNTHPPSKGDATVERNYPDTISDLEYPRCNMDLNSRKRNKSFFQLAGFASNGPPCNIGYIIFNDIFAIPAEGDYSLTVQPVLYRMHNEGGTFQGYLDRVDLPIVTTKIHLLPSP